MRVKWVWLVICELDQKVVHGLKLLELDPDLNPSVNLDPDLVALHWLYLVLYSPMPNGCHYILRMRAGICMMLDKDNLYRHSINDMLAGTDLVD